MKPFLQQLTDLVQAEPARAKWVVTPSLAVGHNIAERLISEGITWGNLRFTTVFDLAVRIAGPALARVKRTLIDPAVGPALALQLLLDLPATLTPYFRVIAEQPGVAEALWSTITELRLADIGAEALQAQQLASPAKAEELRALLRAYERYLEEHHLADAAGCLTTAMAVSNKFPVTPDSLVLEMFGACDSPLERAFLDSLPARRIPVHIAAVPGLKLPNGFERVNGSFEPIEPTDASSDASHLAWLARPIEAPRPLGDGSLALFRAAGREAEVEEVLRRIHASALPLGSVEVVCAQPAEYAVLFWEKAALHNLPVTIDRGIPGALTRPVRAALGLCDWIENNFPAVRLARMLEAGILEPGASADMTGSAAARILRQCGATLGRKSYSVALAAFAASCDGRAGDLEVDEDIRASYALRAVRARQLARWTASMIEAVPEPSGGSVDLGSLLDALDGVLNDAASVASPQDAEAKAAVVAALSSLAPLRELCRATGFQLALIRATLESVVVDAGRPSPAALHVSSLGSPSFAGRAVTFVVGLEEGGVFPAGLEDPVLLDDDRRAIAPGRLTTSRERTSDAVYRGIIHLASLRGRVTLSYSCRDLRQGREAYPSWLFFQAHQLLQPGSGLKHEVLVEWLGDPATLVAPAQSSATSDAGWWLSGLRGTGAAAMPLVSAAFAGIARGIFAETRRQSEKFTEYDGLVPAAGADLDPRGADQVFSASRFESFANCPFRFFLERGLGLDPVKDEEPDPDAWLDPMTRGSALHGIYSIFLRRLRAEKRRPVAGDWKILWKIARNELDRLREEIPPPSEAVYAAENDQIERDLRLFLKLEIPRADVVPVAIEAPFGFGTAESEEPLSQADAVRIDIGSGEIRLRGRIDRIDRLADGTFEVIDYKTGGHWDQYDGTFSGGRLLQHALYANAARQLLQPEVKNPRVRFSSYYFCTERGWGERVRKPGNLDVKSVLNDIADAIAAGAFVRGGEDSGCRFCDYGRACSASEVEQAAVKRAALIPIERLVGHA
jgi:ATP-dependent helicase/nuclease subunit B